MFNAEHFVLIRATVEAPEHPRTTVTTAAEAPVYFSLANRDQMRCSHEAVVDLSRFGDARCSNCSALAWSLRWLAVGVFGETTVEWGEARMRDIHVIMRGQGVLVIDTNESQIIERMDEEETDILAEEYTAEIIPLPVAKPEPTTLERLAEWGVIGPMPTPRAEPSVEIVAAELNRDMRANTRRPGLPVPRMTAVDTEWTPEPAL